MNDDTVAIKLLRQAELHMLDRAATYDKPKGERSMGAAVAAFRAATGVSMTEEQGWLFMTMLKIVRAQQGKVKRDNYEDGAAYFALAGEAALRDRM
jgi:ketol-acid reductoisomerase